MPVKAVELMCSGSSSVPSNDDMAAKHAINTNISNVINEAAEIND